jgi:multidrug efflux pump subunit AcrB
MAEHPSDATPIRSTHNTARFFTETRQVAWVLLIGTVLWGTYAYLQMPKRKDPEIPINQAAAVCVWPGVGAEKIEQLVTRPMEERLAANSKVVKIESLTRNSLAVVYITLDERVDETGKEFDDLKLKLDSIRDLPSGAGPIEFFKDFGETSALMLTVASPKADPIDIGLRARSIRQAIQSVRAAAPAGQREGRAAIVANFPRSVAPEIPRRQRDFISAFLTSARVMRDVRPLDGPGFVGVDGVAASTDQALGGVVEQAIQERLHASEFHPDVWPLALVRDPADTETRLAAVAGDKFSYRELDEYTDLIKRTLQTAPMVSKVQRAGVLQERIYLEYSQERVPGIQQRLLDILRARNISMPGGMLEVEGKNLAIDPSGEFKSEREIGDVIVASSPSGTPVYLRDNINIVRGYDNPPRYLNFYDWRDAAGHWRRSRAITLSIQMRSGEQIGEFGRAVDAKLAELKHRLPADLVLARVSDQPVQVDENISLFMRSLYEAIGLVVLVALVGFWEWRSAVLMALAIPLTLAMTFGMMNLLGLDVQQVSIASLIIALGLLVDDPVVAGDAIKRELDSGQPPTVAAWLGPTRLATAILFATITNIVAYLPFLMVSGSTGRFIRTLPIVLACSLVASRIVSMTFIPLLGYYLLRPSRKKPASIEERRRRGFTGSYYRVGAWALAHRALAFGGSLVVLAAGAYGVRHLQNQFFPKDLSYLSYVDVWLPEDATLAATNVAAQQAETIIRRVADEYGKTHTGEDGKPLDSVLASVDAFVGGGGPRFWFSIVPELQQLNYAQLIIKVTDKHTTEQLVGPLQKALSESLPGVRADVRQLETGKPVGIPVSIRISGDDIPTLRGLSERAKQIFKKIPAADRVRDDWGADSFAVKLHVDPDRANFAGFSNQDVALSSAAGLSGMQVTTLREFDREIPVVARLRPEERAQISDLQNLYVFSTQGPQKIPLRQVSSISYGMETEKIRRRNQFRTITVSTFPAAGRLPSEVMDAARAELTDFQRRLPIGYSMEIAGEEEEQVKGFHELGAVMAVSVGAIFLALVFQFRNAFKPFIVFSAIPYGTVGALAALAVMGKPFGFMAFLGVASLVGVIVSHVIVLFDFIEEMHEKGEPLRDALLDAGIVRLRPVMITVGATVFGLIPLALHGGPLWEPLCYAQIGGLMVATFTTLLLVPVLYAIAVLDLKIVAWKAVEPRPPRSHDTAQPAPTGA